MSRVAAACSACLREIVEDPRALPNPVSLVVRLEAPLIGDVRAELRFGTGPEAPIPSPAASWPETSL
jgi:hypothetical protein